MPNRTNLRSSVRALFGAWAGDRPAPLPELPHGLPELVLVVARDAAAMLAHYQGVAYARLYLHRLRRFIGRRDVDDALFARIARLMADRMAYEDPVRLAQIVLDAARAGQVSGRRCAFRFDELIAPLPGDINWLLVWILDSRGWSHRSVTRRYSAASAVGRARLRLETGLRYWRALSDRYERERRWVERWLHMIDRALTKQPASAVAVADTATMIHGHGEGYRRGLADWHLVIEGLAKPTFDGALTLPDLASAIAAARAAAVADTDPARRHLKATIAALLESAGQKAA